MKKNITGIVERMSKRQKMVIFVLICILSAILGGMLYWFTHPGIVWIWSDEAREARSSTVSSTIID